MKYRASSGEKQIEHLKALSNYPHWDFFYSVWLSDKASGGFHSASPPSEFYPPSRSLPASGESLQEQPVPSPGTLQRFSNSLSITGLNHTEQTVSTLSHCFVWAPIHRQPPLLMDRRQRCALQSHQKQDAAVTGRTVPCPLLSISAPPAAAKEQSAISSHARLPFGPRWTPREWA